MRHVGHAVTHVYHNISNVSDGAFALATGHRALLTFAPFLPPPQDVLQVSPVEALRTPHERVAQGLPSVAPQTLRATDVVALELLGVSVEDCDGVEADTATRKHVHAVHAEHDLGAGVLGKVVVAFHLGLARVDADPLGYGELALGVLAVEAVEVKGFDQGLPLSLDFDGEALLCEFEFVLALLVPEPVQQKLIVLDEAGIEIIFIVLESQLALLVENLQKDADIGHFLDLAGFVQVLLENLFRLSFAPKDEQVLQGDGLILVHLPVQFAFIVLHFLGVQIFFGVVVFLYDREFLEVQDLVLAPEPVFGVGVLVHEVGRADEDGHGLEVSVFVAVGLHGAHVLGHEVDLLLNLPDHVGELDELLVADVVLVLELLDVEDGPF